jgi:valyl-tRNA synthetase
LEEQFELLFGTIRTIRNLRAEADVKPGVKVTVNLQTASDKEQQILTAGQPYIKDLAKVENLTIAAEQKKETFVGQKSGFTWTKIVLIIGIIYLFKVGLVVADAVDDIPLIGSFFKIVGFGYSAWFIIQKLLLAEARQKFWEQLFPPTADENQLQAQTQQPQEPEKAIADVVGTVQVVLPLAGVVDIDALRAKIEKRLSKVEGEMKALSARLSNPNFVQQARPDVVQGARNALAEAEKQAEILRDRLLRLA